MFPYLILIIKTKVSHKHTLHIEFLFIVLPQRFLGRLKIIGALLTGIVIQIILALTTALVFAGIFVIRNLSIPAITNARIALNLIAMNYVLSLFHLIAKHYLNHLTFVLDVLMKKSVNVITLITLHIVLMLNIANSYTMLALALEQVLNVLWN